MQKQILIFLIFLLNGFLYGIYFDIFRILRKNFKTNNITTYFEDFLFWGLVLYTFLCTIFKFNNGELRLYVFIAVAFGILIYLKIFSDTFIYTNNLILKVFKKIFNFIIIQPIEFILKILSKIFYKPITFICINMRKILSNLLKKRRKKRISS